MTPQRLWWAVTVAVICTQIPTLLFGVSDSAYTRDGFQEVQRLEESAEVKQAPDVEGSVGGGDAPVPAPDAQPSNPNPSPPTAGQNQEGLSGSSDTAEPPPPSGGDSASADSIKPPPPPGPANRIIAPPPAPPAPDAEYHAFADFHNRAREADRQAMEMNGAAASDHGSADEGNRFVSAQGSGAGPDPATTPENEAQAAVDNSAPQETEGDPDAPARPDPKSILAWTQATGSAYTGDRNAPPEVMAPTDGRVDVVHVTGNKQQPFDSAREFPYPPAPPDGSAHQSYIWSTTTSHQADTWKPVYNGLDPHQSTEDDIVRNGVNGLSNYKPTFQDDNGRDAPSEPLIDPERTKYPGMRQYVAPAMRADEEEPATPTVPRNVSDTIKEDVEKWLKQQEDDIDNNPENDGGLKWKEVADKSKEYRGKQATVNVKERLQKWIDENLAKQRAARENAKKSALFQDIKDRSVFERQEKVNVTSVERSAKALNEEISAELTTKEREQKPTAEEQKTLDDAAEAAKVKEAKAKYAEYDIVQETAEKVELKREADEAAEHKAKHDALEKEAAGTGETLAETMGDSQQAYFDILAKDAMTASVYDKKQAKHASKQEQNVAVNLEMRSQQARLPALKPGALAETGHLEEVDVSLIEEADLEA